MKAISLQQPWATLVAIGAKEIETRSWQTNYRGPLAIHASKSFPADAQILARRPPFNQILIEAGYLSLRSLPLGAVLATANLFRIQRIANEGSWRPESPELDFGNYQTGRFMWFLTNIEPIYPPIPASGSLGLWDWDEPADRRQMRLL